MPKKIARTGAAEAAWDAAKATRHARAEQTRFRVRNLTDRAILRRAEVAAAVGLSMKHIATLEKEGKFPPRVVLGISSVGWRLKDVEDWIDAHIAAAPEADTDRVA